MYLHQRGGERGDGGREMQMKDREERGKIGEKREGERHGERQRKIARERAREREREEEGHGSVIKLCDNVMSFFIGRPVINAS